jgi:hypothetical protein
MSSSERNSYRPDEIKPHADAFSNGVPLATHSLPCEDYYGEEQNDIPQKRLTSLGNGKHVTSTGQVLRIIHFKES